MSTENIKDVVREKSGEAAKRVLSGTGNSCCGAAPCCAEADPITRDLYDSAQTGVLPEQAVKASLRCGNPTALAQLKAGATVLHLISRRGMDVLISPRRVRPSCTAHRLYLTDEMPSLGLQTQP